MITRTVLYVIAADVVAWAVLLFTSGPVSLAAAAVCLTLTAAVMVMWHRAQRHRIHRATRRADRDMVEVRHRPGATAGVAYVQAALTALPDRVFRRLADYYVAAAADNTVADAERRALALLRMHGLWDADTRADLAQLAAVSGAAATAAVAALAAPFLGPADVDRLTGAWRRAGLPLLSGAGVDPHGRALCAPAPVGAGGPRIPADQIADLAQLITTAVSLTATSREQLTAQHRQYVPTVMDYGPIHYRAQRAAIGTGRWAAAGMDSYAGLPQAVQDAALATLIRDLIDEHALGTLTHTWQAARARTAPLGGQPDA